MMTARQWTAQQMLDWGMVSEVVPKDKVMDRGVGDRSHVEDHALREPHHHVQPGQASR